jgi:hypothetical protein
MAENSASDHHSDSQDSGNERFRKEPTVNDDGTISLWGVGPTCPGCGGPTHAVTAEAAKKPWWCKECNVRFDDDGNYGNAASFPAGNEPDECSLDTDSGQ